jgi:hypothetical protein
MNDLSGYLFRGFLNLTRSISEHLKLNSQFSIWRLNVIGFNCLLPGRINFTLVESGDILTRE